MPMHTEFAMTKSNMHAGLKLIICINNFNMLELSIVSSAIHQPNYWAWSSRIA